MYARNKTWCFSGHHTNYLTRGSGTILILVLGSKQLYYDDYYNYNHYKMIDYPKI